MEIWKDIPWYKWLYQASSLGNIRGLDRYVTHKRYKQQFIKWCRIIPTKRKDWYMMVRLRRDHFKVHRIIWSVFLGIPLVYDWKNCILHKNDVRHDNRIDNLFIWSYKDNVRDMINKWRARMWINNWSWEESNSYLKTKEVLRFRELFMGWLSIQIIAKMYWIPRTTVGQIVHKKRRINI